MTQFTLPLFSSPNYHMDEFIVSSSNYHAYNAVKQWKSNWGVKPYPFCMLLYGAKSSGKTYITKIWQQLSKALLIENNTPLSADILTIYDNFIIEDIEHDWSPRTILHYINFLNENKKYLLITTGSTKYDFALDDLVSRINSIFKITISQPDDELMRILIFKYFSNYSIKLSSQTVKFLLAYLPRNFNSMLAMMNEINNFALIKHRNITIPLIKEVIRNSALQYDLIKI